ncbi:MAG: hypothetical protein KDA53_02565 [Hyphomonas sp.]|nr:hypothetical protein [Hyphomonas sp.]
MTRHPIRALAPAAFAALAAFLPAPACADPDPVCPAGAEQTLYDMETAIRQGTQTDIAPVIELAEWGIDTCPDRPDVQAIAATLMSAAIGTSGDLDTVETYLTQMMTAIRQNDFAWNTKQKPSLLKQGDGSEQNYFGYNAATSALLNTAIPYLIRLGNAGRIHPAISGEPYDSCPYPDHAGFRLGEEANLWDRTVKRQREHPAFGWAENRLTALHAACPAHKKDLDFALARFYGQEVDDLTRWEHVYLENINFGNGGWIWTNPSLPQKVFNDDALMQAKKAELDAIARPLADKARPYIEGYLFMPPGIMRGPDERFDEVKIWQEAIGRLQPAPQD